ncbi:major facilitator superfamily domain-containing protein [Mycena floridula]|nr:major facilitator superfamily domain-containing protein [Mycena floridula]
MILSSSSEKGSVNSAHSAAVGREQLSDAVLPHESYEGFHRYDPDATWTVKEEAIVVRKNSPFFGLQLDRGNLGNALTDNFLTDMKLSTNDYNNGTTIQLLCFLTAEFPVQLLIKRYGFRRILPTLLILRGTVSFSQAWITTRAGFYVTRALIGASEGGFIPGSIIFCTYFYKTGELSVRLALFSSTLNIARTISALLAAGILKIRGVAGKPGCFWLFLLEGALTVILGAISYIYLPSSPVGTKTRQEVIIVNRVLRDDPSKGLTRLKEPVKFHHILEAWKDPSMWGLYFIGLVAYIPATPRLGFSTFNSDMLQIPAAVLQIITMLILARSSEYFEERTWHCVFGEFWILPLLAAFLFIPAGGRNWGRFTIATMISGYPYFHPIVSSWISENTFDVKKRAITAATYNVVVQIGSLIGSHDAPYYYRGNKVLISICREHLRLLNRRKKRMSEEEKAGYQADTIAREKEGNRRFDFRFAY